MKQASELIHVPPNYAIWQAYDPGVKAELFSTALQTGRGGVVIVDPIPLAADARLELGKVEAVLITNANHARAAADFADAEAISIPTELANEFPKARYLADEMRVHQLTAIAISGAAPGEFAFHDGRDAGALIVGDAIINFEPHGFSLLPAKYCVDRKQMIRSLRRLLDFTFDRVFFAHGSPMVTRAHARLAALLDELW
jgi:glyoxylase-like metal-dependent hydrolase (beta-lactamase superfamily II)